MRKKELEKNEKWEAYNVYYIYTDYSSVNSLANIYFSPAVASKIKKCKNTNLKSKTQFLSFSRQDSQNDKKRHLCVI